MAGSPKKDVFISLNTHHKLLYFSLQQISDMKVVSSKDCTQEATVLTQASPTLNKYLQDVSDLTNCRKRGSKDLHVQEGSCPKRGAFKKCVVTEQPTHVVADVADLFIDIALFLGDDGGPEPEDDGGPGPHETKVINEDVEEKKVDAVVSSGTSHPVTDASLHVPATKGNCEYTNVAFGCAETS